MSPYVVKARSRQGTKSLDLTIPVKIATELKIKEGDVFSIEVAEDKKGKLIIKYIRILNS